MPATPPDPALSAAREGKIKVAMIGFVRLLGMHIVLSRHGRADHSALDQGHHSPVLAHRYQENHRTMCDRLHRGRVANEDNIETLRHFRDNCDVLISLGACAVWGGVPAMRNVFELKDCLSEAYINSPTAVPGAAPIIPSHPDIPRLTTKVYPCHEVVKMDYFIPGCPPDADVIFAVLDDLIPGRPVALPRSLNHYD